MASRGSERGRGRGRGRGGPPGADYGGGGFGRGSSDFRGRGRGGLGGGRGGAREQGGIFSPGTPANIDARLNDRSQEDLIQAFRTLSVHPSELPLRPGFGTVGKVIKLRANFFPVKIGDEPVYEYEVAISPAAGTAARRVKRRIFQLAEQTSDWSRHGLTGRVAHDHSAKLIAAEKLPQPLSIFVRYYDEDQSGPTEDSREYALTISFIQPIEKRRLLNYLAGRAEYRGEDIMPIITALNVILAAHPNRTQQGGGVLVGRNRFFFPTAAQPFDLGGGLEAWKGFYSSVRPTHNQLMVNVNVCTTAFYKPGNLARAMIEFRDSSFGARLNAFVKGIRVRTTHLGYKKTIKTVSNLNARQHAFDAADLGGTITVEQYFKRKYNKILQYPELPLVDVGGQKSNLLPAEVCEILPNQPFRGKLTDEHTASMITAAAKPPNVNAAAIVGPGLNELGFRQSNPTLTAFGVSIGTEMTVVPGRILPPPSIQYGRGQPAIDERASWNLRNVKFSKGAHLTNWAVFVISDGNPRDEFSGPKDADLLKTIRGFMDMCKTCGITVDNKDPPFTGVALPRKDFTDPIRTKAIAAIQTALKQLSRKPSLVLVILSNGDKHIYSGIKHLCDVYLDIATVCVHSSKIRKEMGQMQYFANVALKVNMKLGGVNHALDPVNMKWLKSQPTMLVGIDVTHPGPGSVKGTPSIAAVVASSGIDFAQYPASMEIQESKKEMVTNLSGMMHERLSLFLNKNRFLPERILVYRDGVSEGQFSIVLEEEMPAMIKAFKKFDTAQKPYRPKLAIVICGKRHHTRFYPTEAENADRNGNPRPGTVVDRGVTTVYNFDFFLQAHGGLQGTTKPTHYYVVHDEIGFDADTIQGLTNAVSYMFARATKAVSLVSPAYYADLACERGRCYLHALLHGISSSAGSSVSQANEQLVFDEATRAWKRGVAGQQLKDTMFYL
ncbi:argonaute-like protein [Cyathus striatus]|nr:argonaute-like protein [Cyathus striatus]